MEFEDIKVGMKVVNTLPNGRFEGVVGTVFNRDESNMVIVKYEVPTNSDHNTEYNEVVLWSTHSGYLEPFIDPEEDLIVWGALEAGEKFQVEGIGSTTYLKIDDRYYTVLGSALLRVWNRPSHWKVQLVD